MNYQYIEQLLDRYWRCETSLEEEQILRAFFQQSDIPESMKQYQPLFICAVVETQEDVLGEDFDQKMLSLIGEEKPKAKVITLSQRLMPFFRAAAVVAIILTLGNALQVAFLPKDNVGTVATGIQKPSEGPSVAKVDTAKVDTATYVVSQQPVVIVK